MLKFLASAGGGRARDSAEACVAFFKRAYAARVQPFSIRHNPQRALRDGLDAAALLSTPKPFGKRPSVTRPCARICTTYPAARLPVPVHYMDAWDDSSSSVVVVVDC